MDRSPHDDAAPAKQFRSLDAQIDLLIERGMEVPERAGALRSLESTSYYRLSGYWYPFRMQRIDGAGRSDRFLPGTSLDDVTALHAFDLRLRNAVFSVLTPIELAFRALVGHELGRISPTAHREPERLGPMARDPRNGGPSAAYVAWRSSFTSEVERSREDFVVHHRQKYGGTLPIWAAVEVLSWGQLIRLFSMAPPSACDAIASRVRLSAPQLESWLKALNILRNVSAHHGRLFNRVFTLTPKLPRNTPDADVCLLADRMHRSFGQLTLAQHLARELGVSNPRMLPAVLSTFPEVARVPISATGAPQDWSSYPLWQA